MSGLDQSGGAIVTRTFRQSWWVGSPYGLHPEAGEFASLEEAFDAARVYLETTISVQIIRNETELKEHAP